MLADSVGCGAQEVGVADAWDLDRILEGHEETFAGAFFRVHFQKILALEKDFPFGNIVRLAAGENAR